MQLRYYQHDALQSIWDYYASGNTGNPVIAHPTGTGKSILPAVFIERIMRVWPTQRFMLLTHVKELISQNAEALLEIWPNAPVGIYSAGLKSRDIAYPIIYAGIQSAIKNPMAFGHRDIIFIDECHLVNQDDSSQYQTFLAAMKLMNPQVKIIGMSATPFRMGLGLITDGNIFTDTIHDITNLDNFNRLISEGYLAPLIPLRTRTELDVSTVGIRNSEYIPGQLQAAVDKDEITKAALKEVIAAGENRKSWLIFSSGIEHAEHISDSLNSFGINCASVHSKRPTDYCDNAIKEFKAGNLRSIVNYSKLTTGFNHPAIDLLVDLRPTMSIPLHIQKLGRGTRPAPGKENCLVLDFARNVPRLGPINDPIIPRKKGEKQGDPPIKICENCGAYNHASVRICCNCGEEFTFKIKIVAKSGNAEIIKSDLPTIEIYDVHRVIYNAHNKVGSPTSMAVSYFCGLHMFREWICLEHGGIAGKIARDWWRQVHKTEPPKTVSDALQHVSELRTPKRIKVIVNRKFPEIIGREF
jgi:DNA repair protein RadD